MTYDPNRPTNYANTEREIDKNADKAHAAVDTAQQKATELKDRAANAVDDAKAMAGQVADRADDATTTAGEKLSDAAQALRDRAPSSGPVGEAAAKTADTLDRAGSYLQEQDLNAMRGDLENIIRRHPIESLLVGLGVGYLLARSTRR